MADYDDIIRYESEGTALDFKLTQYTKPKYHDLIKDVMAMANAHHGGDRLIIIGVKHYPSGEHDIQGLVKDEFVDAATYEQIIRDNVEPEIHLEYFPYSIDGKLIGIIRIHSCADPPYMMRKDYNALQRGDCYIRKGTQQMKMVRRDFDRIIQLKTNHSDFSGKIRVGFTDTEYAALTTLHAIGHPKLSSHRAKERIDKIINERDQKSKSAQNAIDSHMWFAQIQANLSQLAGHWGAVPYEDRTTEELQKCLENISETYAKHDRYELIMNYFNEVNIAILNESGEYIKDASVEMVLPPSGIIVADRIPQKPRSDKDLLRIEPIPFFEKMHYPEVERDEEESWIIRQDIGDIKHHIPTRAFQISPRVGIANDLIGKAIPIKVILYAENITTPMSFNLSISVNETDGDGEFDNNDDDDDRDVS